MPPIFQKEAGGVVAFYHVAKTGGSTIRGFLERLSRERSSEFRYIRFTNGPDRNIQATNETTTTSGSRCVPSGRKKSKMRTFHESIKTRLLSNSTEPQKTLLFKWHGESMGLKNLAPYIQQWRSMSHTHNTPFFAFALVRDPIPFAVSCFKFFHLGCELSWCEHDQYDNATEDNLLLSVKPNQQCFLLTHTSANERMHPSFYQQCKVTQNACEATYKTMKDSLDWIGTTEKLSTETMPLLSYLLEPDRVTSVRNRDKNVSSKLPFEQSLNESTITQLRSLSNYDQMIYDQVKRD